jgi:hypothetical protein
VISGGQLKRTGDAAGQADLPPMRMPAQQEIKSGMRGLAVNFRRMGQKNRKVLMWYGFRGLLYIVHPVKMGIIDPRQMNPLPAAVNGNRFVEEHTYSHPLKRGDHADRIVVAQDAEHLALKRFAEPGHLGKDKIDRSKSLSAIVAS